MKAATFPLAPLQAFISRDTGRPIHLDTVGFGSCPMCLGGGCVSQSTVAELCGVHPRTAHRWAHHGLRIWQADRAACALNVHPSTIWPEWVDIMEATTT